MFQKFNIEKENPPALSLKQFQKFLFAIGMDFINIKYDSGQDILFADSDRVYFEEFIDYLIKMSTFEYDEQEYRDKMAILD